MVDLIQEQANLAKLGERLKAIRDFREMSPLKLAAEMESSLTSVRDWESGARKLQSGTIRRLAEALELSYPEEMYWLGLSGHIPHTRMPSKDQIMEALGAYAEDLDKLPYPAQIIDHHFTYWIVNSATLDFIGDRAGLVALLQNKFTALDAIFNSNVGFFHRISQPNEIHNRQRQLMRRIVGRSLHRRHEPFFQTLPDWMRGRLSAEDFDNFYQIWEEANAIDNPYAQRPSLEDDIMLRYFTWNYPNGRTRRLQMRADHLRHFGDLFEITLYYPFDGDDSKDYQPGNYEGIKLWEVTDIDHLLRSYEE
ncbi:MAG: helix-turn-helix transcriptional regulator [Chloroflexota bacterium]